MSGLRRLLRFEDKVAAEGRRLENLGGPSMRWVAPIVLLAAVALHAAILILPAVRTPAMPAVASPAPEFPLVWRRAPAPIPPKAEALVRPDAAAPEASPPAAAVPQAKGIARPLMTEPVPEPVPELVLSAISPDTEVIIPYPGTSPSSLEVGPPSGAAGFAETPPKVLERVQPIYPVAARSLHAEGNVTLRLAVQPDGRVGRALVEECSRTGLGFEAAALAAVKLWRYEPAMQPDLRTVIVTIHFQNQDGRP